MREVRRPDEITASAARISGSIEDDDPLVMRLVSIIFAAPSSPVWDELQSNRAFLDDRSGEKWDLYFAGAYFPERYSWDRIHRFRKRGPRLGKGRGWMDTEAFRQLEDWVRRGLRNEGLSAFWNFSGGTDLVSFMCYDGAPDWASTKAVTFSESNGLTLGRVTEGLVDWREDAVNPDLAPGQFNSGTRGALKLLLESSAYVLSAAVIDSLVDKALGG